VTRPAVAVLLVVGIVATAVAISAEPAAAHGVGGIRPSNYQTVVTSITPRVPGIDVRSVDLGDRLELENHTDADVVVLGYDDEPYLRVGPRGAFENARSPATYVNRTLAGRTPVPERADPEAAPVWRRISREPVARWHDHRSHWMGRDDPRAVRDDPGHAHVIQVFRIDLERDGTPIVVRGEVRWVPGASPWLWLALAFVAAAAIVAMSRTRLERAAVASALLSIVLVETLHVVGAWGATTEGTGARLGASLYAIGAVAVAAVALVWVLRRGVHAAAPLVIVAGLFVAIAGGLADLSVLSRSQLPTTLPVDVARLAVAAALGLGVGLAVVGALRLRPSTPGRRAQPAS
jgi:hypothetical protein